MNTLDKLNALSASCCSLHVDINDHRTGYEDVATWFEQSQLHRIAEDLPEWKAAHPDEWSRMLATDTLVTLQVYPNTPIGFEFFYGESIESVVDQAWEKLAEHCQNKAVT